MKKTYGNDKKGGFMSDIGRDYDVDKAVGYGWCSKCRLAHEIGCCEGERSGSGTKGLRGGKERKRTLSDEEIRLINEPYFKKGE